MSDILPNEILLTLAPIAVLSLALAAVAVSYVFLLIKLGKSEKDRQFLQSRIRDQAADILREAHEKRLKIIQDATDKASMIVKDIHTFNLDTQSHFSSEMQALRKTHEELLKQRSEDLARLYDQFEVSAKKQVEEQFRLMSKNMEKLALSDLGEFKEVLESERIYVRKQLEEKLDKEFKEAQKNVEDYKTDQIKKVDRQVFEILHALIRDVLGRSLSLKDHEELVQKALAEMKTEMNVNS